MSEEKKEVPMTEEEMTQVIGKVKELIDVAHVGAMVGGGQAFVIPFANVECVAMDLSQGNAIIVRTSGGSPVLLSVAQVEDFHNQMLEEAKEYDNEAE